jgi:hypothetical protein
MLWVEQEVMELKIAKNIFFSVFLTMNECLPCPEKKLYGIMIVKGTIGFMIVYLDTIYWPVKHICALGWLST